MNFLASSVRGAAKNCSAGAFSISRPRCSSTTSPATRLRLAEVVRGHHHLDAARADLAHDVLDRLGGGGIEAGGRLVEEQKIGVARERARQRQPLLLAARQPARRPALEPADADVGHQLRDARCAPRARHVRGGERIADIAGGAAPQHGGALEQEGAPGRRLKCSRPPQVISPLVAGISPMAARSSVVLPAPFGPISTVGRAGVELQRDAVEDRHLAGEDAHIDEHDGEVEGLRAHAHPA